LIKLAYIDASIIGELFDNEFSAATIPFFELVKRGKVHLLISDLLEAELLCTTNNMSLFINTLPQQFVKRIRLTEAAANLADLYFKAVRKTIYTDCLHIAMATLAHADVLLSWDYKRLVNFDKINAFNSVNSQLGYNFLKIKTPKKFLMMITENNSSISMILKVREMREELNDEIKDLTYEQKREYLNKLLKVNEQS
jgi:predicted nucleic acid-binding protein